MHPRDTVPQGYRATGQQPAGGFGEAGLEHAFPVTTLGAVAPLRQAADDAPVRAPALVDWWTRSLTHLSCDKCPTLRLGAVDPIGGEARSHGSLVLC